MLRLGLLKKKYQEDSKKWEEDLKAEQEAHKIDLIQSQRQLDQLQNEIADLEMKAKIAELSGSQSDLLMAKASERPVDDKPYPSEAYSRLTASSPRSNESMNKIQRNGKQLCQREMLNRDMEAAKANAELENLKEEMAKMVAERNDFGSLFGRSFKILFGGGD
jgi:G3E family GTPase